MAVDGSFAGFLALPDTLRQESAETIAVLSNLGVQPVLLTGDHENAARTIAGKLQIREARANCLPEDKLNAIGDYQAKGMPVCMIGDGVNDSPALKKADVGFAMGSGTEVAKEAGDITILDDNFLSIEKAILYGRTMFKSIRKFLIFQLTVNVAAVLTCFLAPLFGENEILTVIQLLVVNLAMDTLAAIAFGSEPALMEYMKEKPIARDASIVTGKMILMQ